GRGEASVSFYYQYFDVKGGLFSRDMTGVIRGGYVGGPGNKLYHGEITEQTGYMEVDYGGLDRLPVSGNVAFVGPQSVGTTPHAPRPGEEPIDDGRYRPQFQDASLGARFSAVSRPLAVIPFLRWTFPTHRYVNMGHSSVGRGLQQLQVGT